MCFLCSGDVWRCLTHTHTHASNESHTPRGVQRQRLFLACEDSELIQLVLPLAVRAHVCTRRTDWGMLGPKMFFPEPHEGFGLKNKTRKKEKRARMKTHALRPPPPSPFFLINLTKDARILVVSLFSFSHGFSAGSYRVNFDLVCFFARETFWLIDLLPWWNQTFGLRLCRLHFLSAPVRGQPLPWGTSGSWWMSVHRRRCANISSSCWRKRWVNPARQRLSPIYRQRNTVVFWIYRQAQPPCLKEKIPSEMMFFKHLIYRLCGVKGQMSNCQSVFEKSSRNRSRERIPANSGPPVSTIKWTNTVTHAVCV